jgi:hypothetical protein
MWELKMVHITIINTGDEVLRFVWIYSPQLAGHRKG